MVQHSLTSYVPPDGLAAEREEELDPFEAEQWAISDHSYDTRRLAPLVENAVAYITGWVVRKIVKTLDCEQCREMLVASAPPERYRSSCHLLKLKQTGGLIMPSSGCINIVMHAERHIRRLSALDEVTRGMSLLRVQSLVLAEIGSENVFDAGEHASDTQVGIDNHYMSLIRSVVRVYFNLRQHHIVKLHNLKMNGKNVRHNLTKTILFKGQ